MDKYTEFLEYKDNRLYFDGVDLTKLKLEFPCYVYSRNQIKSNISAYKNALLTKKPQSNGHTEKRSIRLTDY